MNALFVLAALVTAFAAVLVVAGKNLVRAVMALALALLGTAVVYALLDASFLAGVQVLTYVGGVVTLMIFGVMVTRRHEGANAPAERVHGFRGLVIAAGLFALLAWAVMESDLDRGAPPIFAPETTRSLARSLLDEHLIAFEVVSLLLLAAILGAVVLARRRDGRDAGSELLAAATREAVESQTQGEPVEAAGSARGGAAR
ncbi:MAG: NADH-quinone oxidoreductase subunit J [Planctomycetes bacterium]|nr:NADH-quinone oxidoreductase subunit J [Planctomycetota bacterium]